MFTWDTDSNTILLLWPVLQEIVAQQYTATKVCLTHVLELFLTKHLCNITEIELLVGCEIAILLL